MIGRVVVLVVLWVALWGEISGANILTGLLFAGVLVLAFPGPRYSRHSIRVFPAMSFFVYMLRSIVLSSWSVILSILAPNEQRRHAEIIRVQLRSSSELVRAVTANTISLTPGTVVVAVDPETSMVDIHVLGFSNTQQFHDSIHAHEERVMKFIVEKS
jgi:multicomponent Na+:H+ antiporter subunit E